MEKRGMTKEFFEDRQHLLNVYFRCLRAKFGDDSDGMRRHVRANTGISGSTYSRYKRQADSTTHVPSGIPYSSAAEFITLDMETIMDDLGLTRNGNKRAVRRNPSKATSTKQTVETKPTPTQVEPAYVPNQRELMFAAAAKREGAVVSPVEMARTLIAGMGKDELDVILHHTIALITK